MRDSGSGVPAASPHSRINLWREGGRTCIRRAIISLETTTLPFVQENDAAEPASSSWHRRGA